MATDTNQDNVNLAHYVPANRIIPEITLKGIILSLILTIIMAGANAYLGLKIGLTISASIPAAVISMAVLKFFRSSTILENNIVQTSASAGEAVASGAVFTIPALLILGYWTDFPLWKTTLIILVGGTLGVLFSIPLRRAFVVESTELKFPEGIAAAEVLRSGANKSAGGILPLLIGGILGASIKIGQSALMLIEESVGLWYQKGKTVIGSTFGFSMVMVAAGYICGGAIAVQALIGTIITWGIGVPILSHTHGYPEGLEAMDAAMYLWKNYIRVIAVGMMIVGGLWTMVKLIDPIKKAIKNSLAVMAKKRMGEEVTLLRTEFDIPMKYVSYGILCAIPILLYIFHDLVSCCQIDISPLHHWLSVGTITLFTLVFGFIAASISGYMTGIIGASNNPVSSVNMMGILAISVVLFTLFGDYIDFIDDSARSLTASAIAIIVAAVMCCGAAISGDNLQDLKAGHLVGATPWKQQLMLFMGVLITSIFMAPILELLYNAYGISTVFPREGMDPNQVLLAPTASILSALTKATLTGKMNWPMFAIGAAIALVFIAIEIISKRLERPMNLSVLSIALFVYLPGDVTFPMMVGGLIAYFSEKRMDRMREIMGTYFAEAAESARKRGMLVASGLIAGEAIVSIILAIPYAAFQKTDMFSLRPADFTFIATTAAIIIFSGTCFYLYRASSNIKASA